MGSISKKPELRLLIRGAKVYRLAAWDLFLFGRTLKSSSMSRAIRPEHLEELRPLEEKLKRAQNTGCVSEAEEAMKAIQRLLNPYGNHHRLLECRLWYFETLLDANQTAFAESGFSGIRQKTNRRTRLYLEATFFLAVCYLRQKKIPLAKTFIREVLAELNKEQSPDTRRLLQKRVIDRIEEEAVLAELIGVEDGVFKQKAIEDEAIKLVQKSEDDIFELLGRSIPYRSFKLLQDVREDAILQLPIPDRKLLAPPGQASQERYVGKRAFAVLKRVGWKTLCDPKSSIYKLWSARLPKVYNDGYFVAAIYAAFRDWKIGLPLLAAGVVAIAMKYGAEEFCLWTRPDSIMEIRGKK